MHAESFSPTAPTPEPPASRWRQRPPLVRNVDGRPVILWWRILALAGLLFASIAFGNLLIVVFAGARINSFAVAFPMCIYGILLTAIVERDRHAILLGSSRWRLSLTGMFVVVTLLAIILGTLVAERHRSLRRLDEQHALQSELLKLTGADTVNVNDQGITIQISRPSFSDANLTQLAEQAHLPGQSQCILSHVFLSGTAITDTGLAALADCQTLTLLDIGGTATTDAGLQHLANCRGLDILLVHRTQVSSASLDVLQGLPKLRLISAGGTPLAREGVPAGALPNVQINVQ